MPTIRTTQLGAALAAACLAGAAAAGPLDRTGQPVGVIFEEGNYVELSLTHVNPEVSGEGLVPLDPLAPLRALGADAPPLGLVGAASGDVARSFTLPGAAVKIDLGRGLSAALIYDRPFGADVVFPAAMSFYAAGTTASVETEAATGLLRYRHPSGVSVHGGLRRQTYETVVDLPLLFAPPTSDDVAAAIASGEPVAVEGYRGEGARDGAWGWVAGVAYEVPAIAARISLTYSSEIEHELDTVETGPVPGRSVLRVTTPDSVNLDFQVGVAPRTLVFGGVRWTDYSEFAVRPVGFAAATASPDDPEGNDIVGYDEDSYDFTLGVGRQLTESLAGAITVGYGPGGGDDFVSILGPTDGAVSVAVGATYTTGPVEITGAVSYSWLGDADSSLDDLETAGAFEDNDAVGVLGKVAYRF